MNEPAGPDDPSGTDPIVVGAGTPTSVVASDERVDAGSDPPIDVERWATLAHDVLVDERREGELTLTFVDPDTMAELNAEHMGVDGPTDVLSFPLDADLDPAELVALLGDHAAPVLLGDVVVCPAVAAAAAPSHAGTVDDELALLVVHGVLHVLGHDHTGGDDTAAMQSRERHHLERSHWRGPTPAGFSFVHRD